MENLKTNFIASKILHHTQSTRFIVAYSGGVDSHVLLHCMAALRQEHPEWQLSAVHVNHGLQADALQWQQHCQTVCDALDIPLTCFKLNLKIQKGDSVEAIARDARYAKIAELMSSECCLLTGHNQNDQAETLLLQLMRGAGVKGLSAMPVMKEFSDGECLRPLLSVTREQIEAYAAAHQLQWIEDSSNQDLRFDRNFVRHELLPLLQQRWPGAMSSISRSAQHCADAQNVIEKLAEQDFLSLSADAEKIHIPALMLLDEKRRFNVMRYWLQSLSVSMPSEKQLHEIINCCVLAREDADPKVLCVAREFRRYREYLYCLQPLEPIDPNWEVTWDMQQDLQLPFELGVLHAEKENITDVVVRFRRGGEKIRWNGQTHSLKNWFQQQGVPPWQRDRVPLVCDAGHVVHASLKK
ncbi:MAG: tRNA lysidine(34) synthetase TilS [Gammaproteobacteria bacterium]|nr:tRNA lysidine(34) synthetase TilS [Gammaproteobacteria bacterium]